MCVQAGKAEMLFFVFLIFNNSLNGQLSFESKILKFWTILGPQGAVIDNVLFFIYVFALFFKIFSVGMGIFFSFYKDVCVC